MSSLVVKEWVSTFSSNYVTFCRALASLYYLLQKLSATVECLVHATVLWYFELWDFASIIIPISFRILGLYIGSCVINALAGIHSRNDQRLQGSLKPDAPTSESLISVHHLDNLSPGQWRISGSKSLNSPLYAFPSYRVAVSRCFNVLFLLSNCILILPFLPGFTVLRRVVSPIWVLKKLQ